MRMVDLKVFALIGLGLAACKHNSADSDALHTFGELTAEGKAGVFWQPMTAESLSAIDGSTSYLYPSSHPMVSRMQSWSDAMHAELLKTKPAMLPPKPIIRILRSKSFNAYVTREKGCMPVTLTIRKPASNNTVGNERYNSLASTNSSNNSSSDTEMDTLRIYGDGFYTVGHSISPDKCVKITPQLDRIKQMLEFTLKDSARCISITAQGAAGSLSGTVDVGCLPKDNQIYFRSASNLRQIELRVVPSVITFFDRLVKDLSEEEVVAILAHEMGHYYRMHGIVSDSLYDFAYQLDASHNLGSRPKPVPEKDALAALGKDVKESRRRYLPFKTHSSQKLHSYIFDLFSSSDVARFCDQDKCVSTCRALEKHLDLDDMKRDEILQGFPLVALPSTQTSQKFYQDYENLALSCAEAIDAKKHEFEISSWFGSGGLKRSIEPSFFTNASSLKDVLLNLSKKTLDTWIKAQNEEVFALFRRADEARLGIYTDEQEADEVGLELSSRVGIKPEALQTGFLKGLEIGEKMRGERSAIPGELDFAQCKAALKEGFKQFVPIGDYADIHHSACYRVYNAFREAKAHAAALKALPVFSGIKPDPTQWKNIQAQSK